MSPPPEEAEFIPEVIIEEILLRLPIKSLIRFRRVSKHWCRLISSPKFCFRHFSIAQARTFNSSRRASFFVIRVEDPEYRRNKNFITPITVFAGRDGHRVRLRADPNIGFPLIKKDGRQPYMHVLFPVGFGIYCLFEFVEGTALLWNPTIRQTKLLPPSPYYRSFNHAYIYHFGKMDFKDGNFSYKVGRVVSRSHHYGDKTYSLSLELFSSETKSWKLIPDFRTGKFSPYIDYIFHTVNLNGKAHWVIRSAEDDDICITTFDYETEVISQIRAPLAPTVGRYDYCKCVVTLCDEKFLCLLLFWKTNCLDIWVMREYGVEDSWTKQYSFGTIPADMEVLGFSSQLQCIFLRPREDVPSNLVLYDCNSTTIKRYGINTAYRFRLHLQVVEHIKSLISIE